MVNCINLIIEMSPRFLLGRENVPCVAEVVNRSLKADCTDFTDSMPTIVRRLQGEGTVKIYVWILEVTPQTWIKI